MNAKFQASIDAQKCTKISRSAPLLEGVVEAEAIKHEAKCLSIEVEVVGAANQAMPGRMSSIKPQSKGWVHPTPNSGRSNLPEQHLLAQHSQPALIFSAKQFFDYPFVGMGTPPNFGPRRFTIPIPLKGAGYIALQHPAGSICMLHGHTQELVQLQAPAPEKNNRLRMFQPPPY